MKNPYTIKYCPKCKKEVAVINNGNPKGKHSYKCKVCGRQFSERIYPIEVRCLAVKFYAFGYSYRKIAMIFGIKKTPNTIRNWVLENHEYDIDYKQQIEILKEYKEICDNIEILVQCEKALEYHKLKERQNELDDEYIKPNHNSTELRIILSAKQQVVDEICALKKVQYKDYSVKQIRTLQSTVDRPIEEMEIDKRKIETKNALARDNFDLSEIIGILQKLAN